MAEKKFLDCVMRKVVRTTTTIALLSSSAHAQNKVNETAPVQKDLPLEGKLEQVAPLEGDLSDEELKLQALHNAMQDKTSSLAGQTSKDGKRIPLEGRLEQIEAPNVKLPVQLTSKVNKDKAFADIQLLEETPHLDVMPEPPQLLEGKLTRLTTMTSFPDFVVGTWGGHLKVLTRYLPNPEVSDPNIVVDDIGTVVVRFLKEDDNSVTVVPPSVFFQRRTNDREHHVFRRDADFGVKENLNADAYQDYPIIHMGSQRWHNGIGGQWQDNVVHHSLQRIGKKGAEQDTVFERTRDGAPYGYRETIARYTWVRKKKIFVQTAIVDFKLDRTVRKRTTMEGIIVPKWHPYAEEIASIAALQWEKVDKIYNLNIDW